MTTLERFPILISYAMLRELSDDELKPILTNPKLDILVDSGAFSVHTSGQTIEVEDYAAFLKQWKKHLWGAFTLDVIGDPVGTRANHKKLQKLGHSPIPIFTPGMTEDDMNWMYEGSDLIGLGGIQNRIWKRSKAALVKYLKQLFAWADGRKMHMLGVAEQKLLRSFYPYSCDCSNWTYGFRFGDMEVYLGNGRWQRVQSDRKNARMNTRRVSTLPRSVLETMKRPLAACGYTIEDLFDPGNWTQAKGHDHIGISTTAYSWVQYVREFYERFGVRIFLVASTDPVHMKILQKWIDHTAPNRKRTLFS